METEPHGCHCWAGVRFVQAQGTDPRLLSLPGRREPLVVCVWGATFGLGGTDQWLGVHLESPSDLPTLGIAGVSASVGGTEWEP